MTTVILREEKSKSRSGKHAVRYIALIVDSKGSIRVPKPSRREPTKPTYSKGSAETLYVNLSEGEYAVQVRLVKNLKGHVKGWIEVYDSNGRLVYRAVYRKLKLRYSKGDVAYAWIVERVIEHLRLPIKRSNLKPKNLPMTEAQKLTRQ